MSVRHGQWSERVALLLVVAVVLASRPRADENRLWWGEVRLRGPLSEARFDAGDDGTAALALALVAGEDRIVALPLPLRLPLGAEELATVGAPEIAWEGAGSVEWLGWSAEQPATRFARCSVGLRSRSRPVLPDAEVRAGRAELLFVLGAGALALLSRRRPGVMLAAGLLAAVAVAAIAVDRSPASASLVVTEIEVDDGGAASGFARAVEVGALALPTERLEVEPSGLPLTFRLELAGAGVTGTVEARSGSGRPGRFHGVRVLSESGARSGASVAGYGAADGAGPAIADAWRRSPDGAWRRIAGAAPARATDRDTAASDARHGAGDPGSAGGLEGPGPPGWLAAGLPPGRTVFVGRAARADSAPAGESAWFRVVGP